MGNFDPGKALSDETVWYPQGMYNEDGTFILSTADMAALNRYVWRGRLLPTDRDEYTKSLGISDGGEISNDVWKAADDLLATYKDVKGTTTEFHDTTWPRIVGLSDTIYNYATSAGGKSESSYYANMLAWVGQYNEELNKDKPDEQVLTELKQSVLTLTKQQITQIDKLQQNSNKAKKDLEAFDALCRQHQKDLASSQKTLQNLLEGDQGEIAELRKKIAENTKAVQDKQKEYDHDRLVAQTTPAYVWVFPIGTIAAAAVAAQYTQMADALEREIESLKALINQENAKLQADIRLEADINGMTADIGGLLSTIGPAIVTLGKLEGAWETMSGDLQGLHDLLSNQEGQEIPPLRLERVQLDNIVEHWNTLADYADKYRQIAYVSEPEKQDMDTYLAELEANKK
ncbi:hypothetical protein VTN02DRAFT_4189 [Thermoascus thermophilus]